VQIRAFRAEGGGDECEDVPSALKHAAEFDWKGNARFCVLVSDSPCHGGACNGGRSDEYPAYPAGVTGAESVEAVMLRLRRKNIDLIMCELRPEYQADMEAEFRRWYEADVDGEKKEFAEPIKIVGNGGQPPPAAHIIFVLDESGTMRGQPFASLTTAYSSFLRDRRASGQGTCADVVSTIMFNSSARVTVDCQPITAVKLELTYAGGGTCFGPALREALRQMQKSRCSPILIFMSDGGAGDGDAEMSAIRAAYGASGLQVHTISFGSGADQAKLRSLATLGGGSFHAALSGADLIATFKALASESQLQTRLVDEIGKKLSRALTNKLVLDYL
jgi:uncharacterized protein YegL